MNQTGSFSKRWGYTALGQGLLSSNGTISSCRAIQAFNNEILLYDGSSAYSYSASDNAWLNRGDVQSVIVSEQSVIRNNNQQLSPDFASLSGIEVYAWEDSRGTIRYSVLDATNGLVIQPDQPYFTGVSSAFVRPKVLPFTANNNIVILAVNNAGQLVFTTVNPAVPTKTNAYSNILANGLANPAYYDACVSGSNLYIAYYTSSSVIVLSLDSTLTIAKQVTVATISGVPTGAISVAPDASGNIYVSYGDSGPGSQSASTAVYNSALTQLVAPVQTINQATGALSAITAINGQIYAEAVGSQTYFNVIYQNTITASGTVGTQTVFKRGVGLASKPFVYNNNTYINVAFSSTLQSSYFTLDASGNLQAQSNPGLGGGLISQNDYVVPECQSVATGIFKYANTVREIPISEAGQIFALLGVNASKLDFIDSNHFSGVSINQALYVVGGIPLIYDGVSFTESGFVVYPEGMTTTTSSMGGLLGSGTFNYVVCYEHTDNTGKTLPSTPSASIAITFNSGTTNSVAFTIPTLKLTRKNNVKVVVYRTQSNGDILYRVSSALLPTYNNPLVDTVSFTDTLADTAIASNATLYCQPLVIGNSVLENSFPPACSITAEYADRVWLAGLEDPDSIWYSQQRIPNASMQFSSSLTLSLSHTGGAITALARLDDKLIIFRQYKIFYLIGQGPDATGNNSDFTDPIEIPTPVGCVNANTVQSTPLGLFFDTGNGIYLLDRQLNVSYKGAPAQAYTNPESSKYIGSITSATTIPNQWVIFTSASGTALIYDYFLDQWGTFSNHYAVDSDLFIGNNNLLVFASPNGQVFQQTLNAYSDNGQAIQSLLTTEWINSNQVQGFQRVKHALVLGNYQGSHTLNVACGVDYNDSFTQFSSTNADSALGLTTYGSVSPYGADPYFGGGGVNQFVYQFRYDLLVKGESFRLSIYDQQSNPGNQGFTIANITLVLQVKRGAFKVPASKQFGST